MMSWNDVSGYALYDTFAVSNESNGFMLNVGGYSGTAGNFLFCNVTFYVLYDLHQRRAR